MIISDVTFIIFHFEFAYIYLFMPMVVFDPVIAAVIAVYFEAYTTMMLLKKCT